MTILTQEVRENIARHIEESVIQHRLKGARVDILIANDSDGYEIRIAWSPVSETTLVARRSFHMEPRGSDHYGQSLRAAYCACVEEIESRLPDVLTGDAPVVSIEEYRR